MKTNLHSPRERCDFKFVTSIYDIILIAKIKIHISILTVAGGASYSMYNVLYEAVIMFFRIPCGPVYSDVYTTILLIDVML